MTSVDRWCDVAATRARSPVASRTRGGPPDVTQDGEFVAAPRPDAALWPQGSVLCGRSDYRDGGTREARGGRMRPGRFVVTLGGMRFKGLSVALLALGVSLTPAFAGVAIAGAADRLPGHVVRRVVRVNDGR